jgi:uncharacterized membrane protein
MQWFYIQNEQRIGPVEESELFRLAREGQLSPGDLVWNPTLGQQWMPASSVPNLFSVPTVAAPAVPGTTSNRNLMRMALESLRGQWAVAVGVTLLYQVVVSGAQFVPYLSILIILVIYGPLLLGFNRFFLKMARRESPDVSCLFDGFKTFGKTAGAYLLVFLFMCLWTLPVVFAGIVAALAVPLIQHNSALGFLLVPAFMVLVALGIFLVFRASFAYSQVFFILADRPEIGAHESIQLSTQMMIGFKWKKFCLGCRFIGWALLGILTCGIGWLWLYPYMMTSNAHFYEDVRIQ